MPVYKLGGSESGGYRNLLPPDPKPPFRAGRVVSYALAFVIGLVSGGVVCTLLEDRAFRSQGDKTSVEHLSQ